VTVTPTWAFFAGCWVGFLVAWVAFAVLVYGIKAERE
jgi:hypothetical protein